MKEKLKSLQSFALLLIISLLSTVTAWADDTYYYACITLTDGAMTKGSTPSTPSFIKGGATLTTSTDLSIKSTAPGSGSIYYESSSLASSALGTSSNWTTGSTSNRYARGLKFANGTDYTLVLGTKVATSITFYGWSGSDSRTLTIGGVSHSVSSKNVFFSHEFTKSGNFTGDVTISQDGDMYGILVIETSGGGASTYNVTYNGNGNTDGTVPTDATNYSSGASVTIKGNTGSLVKTGYTFGGWNNKADGSGNNFTPASTFTITKDTTLYAKWTANTYTISLDGNGGSGGSSSVTATYGSALPSFTAPSQSGKQVTGYFTDTSGGTKVINANGSLVNGVSGYTDSSGNWIGTSDLDLYAQWEDASTEKFKFVARTSGSTDIASGSSDVAITMANSYASVLSGGSMYLTNPDKAEKISNKGVSLNKHTAYIKIVLNKALATGDVITFTEGGNNSYQICFSASTSVDRATAPTTSAGSYTVTGSDGISGESTIYVWRAQGNGTWVKNLTISQASSTLYTVSFADGTCGDHGGYTGTSQTQASAGASVTLPPVTPDTGWRFDGWYTANNGTGTKYTTSMVPTSDLTLYAWYVQTFTVTYDDNGSTGGSVPVDGSSPYDTGSTVTALGNTGSLVRTDGTGPYERYTWAGWNTSNASDATNATHYNAGEQLANISANTTFYAVWKHQVTLAVSPEGKGTVSATYGTGGDAYYGKAAGDTFTSGDLVSHGIRLILSATPNTGYHFAGSWGGTGSTDNPADVPVGDNKLPFTANFAANTYEVEFNANANDATGTMANQSFTYDEASKALTSNTYERTGYTFNGWNTAPDGSGTGYTDGQSVQNLTSEDGGTFTLYAQWVQTAAKSVTYVDSHKKGTMPSVVASATSLTSAILSAEPSYIASGYAFKEWCTDAELTIPAVEGTPLTESITLYANYKISSTIAVSPAASSPLVKGASVTSTLAGMTIYAAWGGAPQSQETVIGTTGKASPRVDGFSYTDAGSDKVLSLVASDGTFYSAVQTFTYTAGTVAPVITFSPNTVTITCETAGATIYYTTDGTEPSSSNGTAYSAPFTINANKTIKAIAIKTVDATPYSSAVTSLACTYSDSEVKTTLPVTYNFADGSGKWNYSGNFIESAGSLVTLVNKAVDDEYHNIVFRCSSTTKFSMTNGSKLTMNDNASSSNFIAIPISGINGRIDINVWAPYSPTAEYTLRYVLDTSNGTTVQTTAPSGITTKKSLNKYDTDHYNFRIENITASSGVLYLGRGESSFPDFTKIQVTTAGRSLVADKASVTLGDAQTDTVMVTNYTPYQAILRDKPSFVDVLYDNTTGKLAITPNGTGTGTGDITMAVDTNGDGVATSVDLTVEVTVNGITIDTNPTSAVYDTSSSYSLVPLSVTATHSSSASMTYQWYKNTVNSNTGGTAISGATSATLDTSKISTDADEDASFYYCVVSSANCRPKTSDVAYVLTSKTRRYFQMSNVAGNKETSASEEKITGQIIAGGNAWEENTASNTYRYITRPNTSTAHTYVAGNTTPSTHYFKVELPAGTTIAEGDIVSVQLNGLSNSTIRGIYLRSAVGTTTGQVTLQTAANDGIVTKGYTVTSSDCLYGQRTFYIVGLTGSDYFTDLYISKPAALAVSDPTPASQDLQVGDSPATISVTATGGTGAYTYQWYRNTEESTTGAVAITDATSASYTPWVLTAESVDSVYYCAVTSGAVTVNSGYATVTVSETIDHGYMTIDGTTFSFTDGKCSYMLQSSEYSAQNKAAGSKTQYTNFWTHEGSFGSGKVPSISSSNASYLKLAKTKSMTFYVRKATSFTVEAGNTDRQYTVTVDGVLQGTYTVGAESARIPLDVAGSQIVITNTSSGDEFFGRLNFYNSSMTIMKGAETITEAVQYTDGGAVDYEVVSNSAGAITVNTSASGYDATVATASYDSEKGLLTVTPTSDPYKEGTCVITLEQDASDPYAASTTTLTVEVKKHTLTLEFSLDDTEIPLAVLSSGTAIPSGSLPTLSVKLDGETLTSDQITAKGITVNYQSDDTTIGRFADPGTSYSVIYGGGQGGALIYAYVNAGTHISAAKDYFGLNIKAGVSNAIPSGTTPKEQQRFELQGDDGSSVVTLTYGGYKYDSNNGWSKSGSRGKYHIDGYNYYTRHSEDALDEYKRQLRGMLDETVNQTKAISGAPDADFWYDTDEYRPTRIGGKYSEYERIRPFTLPSRGGYLKFQTHKTGTLTIYVWQNGSMNTGESTDSKKLGSKPRLGYWFDQDGWVKKPKVAPITKTPLTSKGYGRDVYCSATKSEAQLTSKWTAAWGDADIVPMLLRPYCNSAKTDFSATEKTGYIANPYYWMTQSEIQTNLDEEQTIIPKKMTPVPYHNGYMVPEESYLKYVIDVVAGKTYYFYGMMTKVGYVGMNFIENNDVADVVNREVLHLKNTDNMETLVDTLSHDYTIYNEATMPSNYRAGKWNTICLPFALSEQQVEEAFGKGTQLTLYNGLIKKGQNYTIKYLSHVDNNILPGQPYFIKPSGKDANGNDLPNVGGVLGSVVDGSDDALTRITFNVVCIDKKQFDPAKCFYSSDADVNESGTATDTEGFKFKGTYVSTHIDQYSYLINPSTGNLRQYTGASGAGSLNPYRAYLWPNHADVKHNAMSQIDFETNSIIEYAWLENETPDIPTDVISIEEEVVEALNSGRLQMPNKAYNIMGQEIDPRSAKGLVIINGKKVMY